jgi:hypothetical protein
MRRTAFVATTLAAALPLPAFATAPTTVLLVSADDSDLDEPSTDFLADALRGRGVAVVDPSSVRVTVHERIRLVALAFGPGIAGAAERESWIEETFGSSRAMFVRIRLDETSAPYGDFEVTSVRVVASYRCMDVGSGTVVAAGSFRATQRGEDAAAARERAINESLLQLARSSAPRLRSSS